MEIYTNKRRAAIITGCSILLMAVVAGITMGAVFNSLFQAEPEGVKAYVQGHSTQYMWGVTGWIVILICDLLASWGLFSLYKSVNRKMAAYMGVLRLIYSSVLAVGIVRLCMVFPWLDDGQVGSGELFRHIHAFRSYWQMGLIIFGFHLLLLAPLVCKKRTVQQGISAMLFLAGIGYVITNVANFTMQDYEQYRGSLEAVFVLPMIIGEVGLAIWLLVKGGKPVKHFRRQFACESC